ncbi:MAG: BlaI/MecI/CopY family transcriptional regulator [Acidobacteria bacterium]|nr:BlaI/MecI/CopY family transcriptional regulator [Acidobacteriota bacterium]
MRSPPRPTDAELEILTVLWSLSRPATVREVFEVLQRRRDAQYTTVLKFMQIMADKGLLLRDEDQRAHVYRVAQKKERVQAQLAGDLLQRAFSGSPSQFLIGALSAKKASPSELAELRRLIEEYDGT